MFKRLLTYGNTLCAVEHTVNNNVEAFNLLKLKKEKKELKIIENKQLESLNSVFLNLKKQQHIFLIINNQQVLFKELKGKFKTDISVIKSAFPSIKISDFYYQIASTTQKHFIAICRKSYVESVINKYQKNKISVIGFSLHNLSILELSPFIEQESITTSNAEIKLNNDLIESVQKKEVSTKNYYINNLELSNDFVLPLAGVLSYYLNTNQVNGNDTIYKNTLNQHYLNKRFFLLGVKGGLSVLFLILFTNFIVFSSLHKKASNLNNEVLIKSNQKNTLSKIKNRVDKKTKLVNGIYSISESNISWILNTIGQSVPNKIQLTKLEFQPIKNSIKEGKEIIVLNNKIKVKGISKSNDLFTNWISSLELKKWIEKVVVLNYGKGKTSISSFEFEITIKN